jgi:anti-sigma regulatory factor (Ser/Thr protein kinase)
VVLELDQAFDPGTLPMLRAKVLFQACRAGLSESRAADVVLAVHELAANAIRHGAGVGRLRIWHRTRELCCQVDDGEPPASGLAASPASSSLPSRPGHGLWVVRQVADRVHITSSPAGTRVKAVFSLG